MAGLVQLGTLTLLLDPAQQTAGPSSESAWAPLESSLITEGHWAEESQAAAELVAQLLKDAQLGMICERQLHSDRVVLRVAVRANDHGAWSVSNSHRVKRLRALLHLLNRGWEEGGGEPLLQTPKEDVHAGIQALYALVEDPPHPTFGPADSYEDKQVFTGLQEYENPPRIRTMLYKYQIRSIARMLQMETNPNVLLNPNYVRLDDPSGEPYYINQQMNILRHPSRHQLGRGGILCEQMGVGKTLICLALILVSRHQHTRQPPAPAQLEDLDGLGEQERLEWLERQERMERMERTITDVAIRTYPTQTAADIREAMEMEEDDEVLVSGTPSLASFCADVVAREFPAARDLDLSPGVMRLLEERTCRYHRFRRPPRRLRAAKQVRFTPAECFILSAATLVVVPPILVPQWLGEVETHLEEGALSILVIKDNKDPLPVVEEMMRYDIVLMSIDRFRREGVRNPNDGTITSELLRARWKRIILDEGNIANNVKSDAMVLADLLSIERRWIVSGTPSTGLKQGTESAFESFLESEGRQATPVERTRSRTATPTQSTRKWSKADLEDVSRLGRMISGFLGLEVLSPEDFRRQVTAPLRKADGPAYGAVERIRQIMSAVMVKHRPGVIDSEVALPPSTLSAQKVHLTHLQRLTYNALTALVGSNVWTSQGEDADYFLHARNTADFNQVVANLHLACLWFSSSDMDLEGAYSRTLKHLETKKGITEEQKHGLQEALTHMRAAIENPAWTEWMRSGAASIPCEVPTLPIQIRESWSDAPEHGSDLIDVHSLRLLRDLNERGVELNEVAQAGWDERAKGPQAEALLKAMERAERLWRVGQVASAAAETELPPVHRKDTKAAAEKSRGPKIVKPKKKDEVDARLDTAAKNAQQAAQLTSTAPRPLPSLLKITTASSKISYVVGSILAAPEDKFVMFGTYEEIGHVTEALDLAGISSVYVGAHVARETRKANLKEFAKPRIQVCLLELNFAARGLMIFLSPVWSLDVQAQAIKRIHRIGQTRPTHIDILVTEGTFEEDIVHRETNARSNEQEKRYSRALIENPRFVYAEANDTTVFPVSLVPRGLASDEEKAELASAVAGVPTPCLSRASPVSTLTPLSSRPSTPIVTPNTPMSVEGLTKRRLEELSDEMAKGEPEAAPKRRRVMFAD